MGAFFSRLPCGGSKVEFDGGHVEFSKCGDKHCIYCGEARTFAQKFRGYVLKWLLPHDGWGDTARTTFGYREVADHILLANEKFHIKRNHNIRDTKGWYNVSGTITLPFSVLITDDELVELQTLWVARYGSACPVDQNLDHPNAPKE